MEIYKGGYCATQSSPVGKLQNVHQEENGDKAQQNPLTQQTDTMQHPPLSVPDYHQSASQNTRNSIHSIEPCVCRRSSQNSYRKLSHPENTGELASSTACTPVQERSNTTTHVPSTGTDTSQLEGLFIEMAMQIYQSFPEFEASLVKAVKELTNRVENLEREVHMMRRDSERVNSFSESASNQASSSSPYLESVEDIHTSASTKITADKPEHLTSRHQTDTMMITKHRRVEIRKKLQSMRRRPISEQIDVS